MNLLEILERQQVLPAKDAEAIANETRAGGSVEEALAQRSITPDKIREALGAYYQMPTRALSPQERISGSVLQYIPEESARHYHLLPLAIKDGMLEVGVTDPDDIEATNALNFISTKHNLPYRLFIILPSDLERGLKMYESLTGEVGEALSALETELTPEPDGKPKDEADEEYIQEDAPVTRIVATILRYAVDGKASDIHIEPTRERVYVRFRVDGVLARSIELPIKVLPAVVARIKILASIRLDEKRKPQDGRFSATIDGHRIDFRVSTLPTYHGEKVVMRILDPESGVRKLEDLGMSEEHLKLIRAAIEQPYGIVLISGPTGSGKSTTLYAMLNEVDRLGKNVVSLEDPVEYNIEGVNQSQVRPEIGYTFASGLRSVLRQDPDVIMVGEIRDKETAQLAIQAALTGHLVLSTIHTNSAIGVIPRLVDMGVDPYLIAPTIVLAMAQRLIRRICPGSGKEKSIDGSVAAMIEEQFADLPEKYRSLLPKEKSVLHLAPTSDCPSGTRGRLMVMEALEVTPEIERLILKGGSEEEIYKVARARGFLSMKEDAIVKALKKEIPFEEVNTLGSGSQSLVATDDEDLEVVPGAESEKTDATETPRPTVDNLDIPPKEERV